jgi:demethylmenaquinone methyltransferase/2-methoxy-6-polyprenyl-1,4-benzoquinol methylase
MALVAGQTVLDLGCGTGLSFPWLRAAVGVSGHIIGVDASQAMLDRAARRARRHGWSNVTLIRGQADRLGQAVRSSGIDPSGVHGVLAAYALSVMSPWEEAWQQVVSLAPGTWVAVVDLALATGAGAVLNPAWRLLSALGGSDPTRRPDRRAAADLGGVVVEGRLGGHVRVVAGTVR